MLADYATCERTAKTHECPNCGDRRRLVTRWNGQALSWEVWCPTCGATDGFKRPESMKARWLRAPDSLPITIANRMQAKYGRAIEDVAEGLPPELAAVVRERYFGPTGK